MTDHNRYASYRAHEFSGKRRWKAAVSAIAMIIASAMVMTVGTSAYADDAKFVKDMEDAQAQLAKQTETESDESLDSGFSVDAESNTAESSGDGLDFGALADWSRVEEANILDRIVAFVNEDGTHAVTSSMQNGAFAVADLNDLSEDSDDWQWRIVAVDEKKVKDDATSFSVYLQGVSNDEYVTVDEDGSVSFTEKKDDATALTLAFTDADAFNKALEKDSNTPLRENTFTLSVAADDSSDKKTDGREFVLSDDDSSDASDSAAGRLLTAKGDDNPKKTDASPMMVYVLAEDDDADAAVEEVDTEDNDADAGIDPQYNDKNTKFNKLDPTKNNIVSPKNTVINVFDYWIGDNADSNDYTDSLTGGINTNHPLKFIGNGERDDRGLANRWTGYGDGNRSDKYDGWPSSGGPRSGIVNRVLDDNGYPQLSGNSSLLLSGGVYGNNKRSESLDYLFDPDKNSTGKASYTGATRLLREENGYFVYDSKKNAATFDTDTKEFTLYDRSASCNNTMNGQFFPFVAPEKVNQQTSCQVNGLNHFFGITMTTSFTQRYDGHVTPGGAETVFEFSGDDDVWIFIDNVLVADLGGIHDALNLSINFATGDVTITDSAAPNLKISSTLREAFGSNLPNGGWSEDGTTFANGTDHVLKFYYMERGQNESNMMIKYNLTNEIELGITKVDQYGKSLDGAVFAVYPGRLKEESGAEGKGVGTAEYLLAGKPINSTNDDDYRALSDGAEVSENGMTIKDDSYTFNAIPGQKYTSQNGGKIVFVNQTEGKKGALYQVDDMKKDFGNEFLLREISVPEGYRTVADESVLGFEKDVIVSKNRYQTGTVASPTYQIDASQKLYKAMEGDEIEYFEIDEKTGQAVPKGGLLFAVVQHRHADHIWGGLDDLSSWVAIYGDDEHGYFSATQLDGIDESNAGSVKGSLAAAKEQQQYENTIFQQAGGFMSLELNALPGEPNQYYSFVEKHYFNNNSKRIQELLEICAVNNSVDTPIDTYFQDCKPGNGYTDEQLKAMDNVRFAVTYYYTTEDSLDKAKADNKLNTNTWRVHSHMGTPNATDTYDGFDVYSGSDVRIPNVENRLFFQNFIYHDIPGDTDAQDDNTAWVEGAQFALYHVGEATDKKLYYIPDGYGEGESSLPDNAAGIYLNPDPKRDGTLTDVAWLIDAEGGSVSDNGVYSISGEDGIISVNIKGTSYSVSPAKNANNVSLFDSVTKGNNEIAEYGSNYFTRIPKGEYVLRMVTPSTDVPVSTGKDGKMTYDPNSKTKVTYGMNITEVPVKVTDRAIYANAGNNHDGVTVGNGAGYVVDTLNQYASKGMLNETLTWIAMFLRVNESQDFAEFDKFLAATDEQWNAEASFGAGTAWDASGKTANDEGYIKHRNNQYAISRSTSGELSEAMTTYLEYAPDADKITGGTVNMLFDYMANSDQTSRGNYVDRSQQNRAGDTGSNDTNLGEGEGKLRLYTDRGWSMANIYQDATFGSTETSKNKNTEYTNLTGSPITQVYSESTFVAFYAPPSEMPQIIKVEADTLDTNSELWQSATDGQCDGINNAKHDTDGNTYCRVNYATTVSKARFVISRERVDGTTNGTKEFRTADGWTTDKTKAQKFTSDDQGLLTGVSAWGAHEGPYNVATAEFQYKTYTGNNSLYRDAILYTIEETDPPVGYAKLTQPITFWMYNKTTAGQGNRDASTTYIAVADGTNGVSVSNDGMKLRIENRSSLSIVKVEEGSDAYIYVQMPSGITPPSLEEVLNILNKNEDEKNDREKQYKRVTSPDTVESQENVQVVRYLDTYTKRLEGASFYLKNESTNKFYKEGNINGVNDIDDATKLVSSANGVILNPSDTSNQSETVALAAGNYSLIEVDIPDGYTKVKSGDITFTVEGGSGTGLKFAQMSNNTTPESVKTGVQTSDNGRILYVENRPIPSIVKVEQGTDSDVVIQLNEGYSASDTDICAKIAAAKDGDTYLPYGSPVEGATEANPVQNQVQCFVGYNKTLKGAQFTLSRVAADNQTEYYVVDTDGNVSWSSDNSSVATVIDSKDMGFVLSITGGAGTYTLTEVAAPDGYTFVSKDPIVFGIGSNGHIVNPNAAGAGDNLTKTGVRVSANGLTLYVENKAGVQLPSTGGLNWYWLMLVAALAIAIGLGVRERMRRQMNNLAHTTGQSE